MSVLREQRLLEAAVENNVFSQDELEGLRKQARKEHVDLMELLCFSLRLPMTLLYRNYAEINHYEFVGGEIKPDLSLLRKLGLERALQYHLIPLADETESLVILCANPEDRTVLQTVKRLVKQEFTLCIANPEHIIETLNRYAPVINPYADDDVLAPFFDPVKTLENILNQAYLNRASDIHFEPAEKGLNIRYRIDGQLQVENRLFSEANGAALISRVKVLAELDIAESRIPQDGAMAHSTPIDIHIDIRVATLPTQFGERATLRLLGGDKQLLNLEKIGMAEKHLQLFKKTIAQPHGLILITGPTGSGKSTTLYAALNELADSKTNILTAEDPVEMTMAGISQVQVNSKTSFAQALRSFLRHDPDVIMVGEIRDSETAEIAMKAALTGHLVFSTLHTNSALDSIPRLTDIGVESYLVASTLLCVIAQRLVRRLCQFCYSAVPLTVEQASILQCDQGQNIFAPKGCAHCQGVGYAGRLPLFETLWVDSQLSEAIASQQSQVKLKEKASSFISLAEDGRDKLLQGMTSLAELQRLGLWV
ncbi:MAG: type II/IV secretion system protein [Methylomarinum sp.]|nr:type II/IV secretion system protein [Methylomarinum sp.]